MFDATALGRFQRRRLWPAVVLAGVLGIGFGAVSANLMSGGSNDRLAQSDRSGSVSAAPSTEVVDQMQTQIVSLRAESEALRSEVIKSRREKEHLSRELARALENIASLESAREQITGAISQPRVERSRINQPVIEPPRSPEPPRQPGFPRAEPLGLEPLGAGPLDSARSGDVPAVRDPLDVGQPVAEVAKTMRIRRIFRAKSPGIRLEDLSRHYDVSMELLRDANPELDLDVRPAGHFLREGATVNIPEVEE